MRLLLILTLALIAGCPTAPNAPTSAGCAAPLGPSDAALDADIDAMRDEYRATLRREIETKTPDRPLAGRREAEMYRAEQREKADAAVEDWGKKVEAARSSLRQLAKSNWQLAKVDRHRLLRNKALEK
jgi:hypothetical protein